MTYDRAYSLFILMAYISYIDWCEPWLGPWLVRLGKSVLRLCDWWERRKNPVLAHIRQYRRDHPGRIPLKVKGSCILSDEGLYAQCQKARERAMALGFPTLSKAGTAMGAPLLIVGSGLSAVPLLEEIRSRHAAGEPIMAIKGAHDWLVENGIIPTFAVAADPQQERHDCFKQRRAEVLYLLASQCHPDTWEYMKGWKVILWHSAIEAKQTLRDGWRGVPIVPGGFTTGLRAISLAYIMGYRTLELYGFDGCVTEDRVLKLDGSKMRDEDDFHRVWVGEEGPFLTSTAMIPQAQSLMHTLMPWPGIKVNAHGEGYFQAVLRQGKRQGWPV